MVDENYTLNFVEEDFWAVDSKFDVRNFKFKIVNMK